MKRFLDRVLVGTLLCLGAAVFGSAAIAAEPYPSKVVRLVVAFPPGGATDALARILAGKLSGRLGQQMIVENRPSPSGIGGSDSVAKSAPDGHTLLFIPSLHATNPSFFPNLPYDTVKDFAPVSLVATSPYILAMNPGLPVKSVKELIAHLKKNPGVVNISASAIGSAQHLAAELFKRSAGVDIVLVHYKGSGAILPDLLAGRVSLAFENQAVVAPSIKNNSLTGLAVTAPERSQVLPDLPTMVEAGMDGFVVIGWFGVVAPAQTPADIVRRLNAEISATMQEADVRERVSTMGMRPLSGPPGDLANLISREIALWGKVIREAGIKLQ